MGGIPEVSVAVGEQPTKADIDRLLAELNMALRMTGTELDFRPSALHVWFTS